MKFLSTLLLLGGYLLVYAAIAKSGRFATEPWEGLFQDAYDVPAAPTPSKDIAAPPGKPTAGRIDVPSGGSVPFYPGIR